LCDGRGRKTAGGLGEKRREESEKGVAWESGLKNSEKRRGWQKKAALAAKMPRAKRALEKTSQTGTGIGGRSLLEVVWGGAKEKGANNQKTRNNKTYGGPHKLNSSGRDFRKAGGKKRRTKKTCATTLPKRKVQQTRNVKWKRENGKKQRPKKDQWAVKAFGSLMGK